MMMSLLNAWLETVRLGEDVCEIGNADKLAAKIADELRAAVATNPLLKATGPVLDPKLLFFSRDSSKTRVSVINLSGLASNEAKEDFVNRLQMHTVRLGQEKSFPARDALRDRRGTSVYPFGSRLTVED
jgi:hypothetical protein